MAIYENGMNRK